MTTVIVYLTFILVALQKLTHWRRPVLSRTVSASGYGKDYQPGFCVSTPPDLRISLCAMGNKYILSSQ